MPARMTGVRSAFLALQAAVLAYPAAVAAQGSAATQLALPVLGISVPVGGRATWSATAQTMGSARVDQVTGQIDGMPFTVVIRAGPAGRCGAVINELQTRNNARVVRNANYAPPTLADPVVEAPNGEALFCMPVGERSVLFILRPNQLTASQQEAVRQLAMGAMLAGVDNELAVASRGPAVHGPNAVIRLSGLGLTVPVEAGSSWVTSELAVRGITYDNVAQSGSAYLLSFSLYRAPDGTTCQAALAGTDGGSGQVVARPPWLDSLWHPSVMVKSEISAVACLPTRGRVIVAEVVPTRNDEDARRVRTMLGSVRAAAHGQWGAP